MRLKFFLSLNKFTYRRIARSGSFSRIKTYYIINLVISVSLCHRRKQKGIASSILKKYHRWIWMLGTKANRMTRCNEELLKSLTSAMNISKPYLSTLCENGEIRYESPAY